MDSEEFSEFFSSNRYFVPFFILLRSCATSNLTYKTLTQCRLQNIEAGAGEEDVNAGCAKLVLISRHSESHQFLKKAS